MAVTCGFVMQSVHLVDGWDPDQSSAGPCGSRREFVCSGESELGGDGEPFDWLTGDVGDELVVLVDVEDDEV